MEEHLHQFPFSKYFNYLFYIGCWSYNTKSPFRMRVYMVYRSIAFVLFGTSLIFQFLDMHRSIGSIQKVMYNLCTSTIVCGTTTKVILLLRKTDSLNDLRHRLWRDYYKYDHEDFEDIKKDALQEMKSIALLFHSALVIFYPIALIIGYFSYLWGPRELPFPAYFPVNYDESDSGYNAAFALEVCCGTLILIAAIETDTVVFSFVLQLSIQYKILNYEILKLNELYEDDENELKKKEINKYLRKIQTEMSLKEIMKRQNVLFEYCKLFEKGFNHSFCVQFLGGSILIITNGLQVMKMATNINQKLAYESAYLIVVIIDLFFNCLYITQLTMQSMNTGNAAYSAAWYKMDIKCQKYILMIISQAQRIPRFTAGKLVAVDLPTFLTILKSAYSWLMLFRQVESK